MTKHATKSRVTGCWRGGHPTDGRPGWYVRFGYDEEVKDALKEELPSANRRWVPECDAWWVAEGHEATLRRLLPGIGLYLDAVRMPGF